VFNVIWRVPRPRPIAQRLIIYWAALTLGPILIGASLSLTSWLVTQSMSMTADTKDLQTFLLRTVPILLNVAAFGLLYFLIPNRRVALKDALVGGAAAAVAFELMKRLFALYIQLVPTYALVYGAFATLPIFLLWIHLSWVVILFGAVVVAVLPRWRMGMLEREEPPGAQFFRALRVIEALVGQQALAQPPGTARIAALCAISEEETEQLLERMHGFGWVRRVDSGGWIIGRDLATLHVGDFYRAFVMAAQPAEQHGVLGSKAGELLRDCDDRLDVSLRSLVESDQVADSQRATNTQRLSRPGTS
jgi:membrane protein